MCGPKLLEPMNQVRQGSIIRSEVYPVQRKHCWFTTTESHTWQSTYTVKFNVKKTES